MKKPSPCILGLIAFRKSQMDSWEQPKENSIAAMQHGMEFSDGVEFDLRIDGDGELVIYHDEFVPGQGPIRDRCIERLPTSNLRDYGISTFREILNNRTFTDLWQGGGKTVDIEFKVPHPVNKLDTDEYLSSMMDLLEQGLGSFDLPIRSTLVCSFSPRIGPVANSNGFGIPVTRLMPRIRAWGRYWKVKRMVAMPHFARTSVRSIARTVRRDGMESMGMALEYLTGWTRWINPGPPVGLHGRGLERLNEIRRGMGLFVWPCPLKHEDALLGAGVSIVSDHMDPDVVERPNGSPRWPRPASQPLDDEWRTRLQGVSTEELSDLMKEASKSLPNWSELDSGRRASIVKEQGHRLQWPGSEEKWTNDGDGGIPWGSPRIIGHRGAGKTHSG